MHYCTNNTFMLEFVILKGIFTAITIFFFASTYSN